MDKYKNILISVVVAIVAISFLSVFSKVLAVAVIFAIFLAAITLLFLLKSKIGTRWVYVLFIVAFLIHIAMATTLYYSNFQPFGSGSGDYIEYNQNAQEIYNRVQAGNFSVSGLKNTSHYYAVALGYIYTLTTPDAIMGQLFNAWLVALIVVLVYLIVIEINGSKRGALLVGAIVALYPSLLFFGNLLLKDALIIFLSLVGVLLTIKLIKSFRLSYFLFFYLIAGAVMHLRFYIGYALLFTFIICWVLFSSLNFKKRLVYILIMIFLFGFIPQFLVIGGFGYWGNNLFIQYLNPKTVSYYREIAYAPKVGDLAKYGSAPTEDGVDVEADSSAGSTFDVDTNLNNPLIFIKNSAVSFGYTLLGPFPWQIKRKSQLFTLAETIPLYVLLFFIIKGAIKNFKQYYIKNYKIFFPLVIFSLAILGSIALFINNFGIITRIRIPAIICLLCFLPFGLSQENIIYTYLDKIYNKVLNCYKKSTRIIFSGSFK